MSQRILFGVFASEADILGVVRAAREEDLKVLDVYSPYAVHGLDQALGLKPSRLPWVCFLVALIGAVVKLWFEYWTMVVSWPVNVGGKPWDSLPAFVPVTFEVMVLSSGLSTVFAFLLISRLWPGRRADVPHPKVTDDHFVIALEESGAAFDPGRVQRLFERFHVVAVEERLVEETRPSERSRKMSVRTLNIALVVLLVGTLGLTWWLRPDPTQLNREFMPEMVRTPRYNAFEPNPNFPDGKTLRSPVPGTIARGMLPIHYQATPEDALRAGEELKAPFALNDERAIERGAVVYANFCQACHGPTGRGDGPVALRGFPAPPPLMTDRVLKMKDGQWFHIVTYGQGKMPAYAAQLSPEDRWNVIAYGRALQRRSAPPAAGGSQ